MPVLLEHLQSPNPLERADAACAIGDRLRCKEIHSLDPEVHNTLLMLLKDRVKEVQFEAAITLAQIQDNHALDILLQAMRHRHTRLDAVRALGELKAPEAIPALHQTMQSWWMPWADKLQAAAALCRMNHPEGVQYLTQKIHSTRTAERAAAIHFIGESQHPDALQMLTALLENPQEPLKDTAVRALGMLGDEKGLHVLAQMKKEAEEDLLEDIETAVQQIKNKHLKYT